MSAIAISTSDVPASFCHRDWPTTWPLLVGLLHAQFAEELNTVNVGNTTPSSENRDKPWFRLNADGTPDGWYAYANGNWLRRYTGPDPGAIIMWDGAAAGIDTLDGGEVGAATLTTGPFWERVTSMDAKFPIGVGTLPTSGTVLAVGDTGGAEKVTLALDQIPSHDHGIPNKKLIHQTLSAGVLHQQGGNDLSISTFQADGGDSNDATVAHDNLPQFRAIFFIRRTIRLYHRA